MTYVLLLDFYDSGWPEAPPPADNEPAFTAAEQVGAFSSLPDFTPPDSVIAVRQDTGVGIGTNQVPQFTRSVIRTKIHCTC